MKTNALPAWLLVLMCCMSGSGCAKKNSSAHTGTATLKGPDPRMCACCGGVFIQIDADSNDIDHGIHDIGTIPASFRLDTLTVYPVRVELEWTLRSTGCQDVVDIIQISRIH